MSLLQLPLDMLPGGSIAINDRLSMRICDDTLVYFHYLDPVYSHPFPDVPHRDRAIAMFLDFGTATASQLARAHGLSLRTVGRALKARRQGLHDSFPPPPAARARTVLKDPPQRQRAADMLLSGSSLRQVADALGVSHQTVFRYRLAGRLPGVPGGLAADPPRFEAVETVARGGVLTALPALLQAGLLSDRDRLGPVAGYYGQRAVLLLQAFLLLARVRNPERLRYELPGEWGRLLGLDRSCAPDTLRRKLGELAGGEDAVQAWREQLARQWVSAAADDVATLFVDGHVQVYHGQANLPKHFVSRDRLKLPAAAGYWVHAPGGAPLLCLHQQVDPGMVAELRSAIVPQLEALGLLEPCLGAGQQEPRLTLAFDREGWSPQLFAALQARGIACVTWRKGPQQERWLDAEFRAAEIPLRTPFGEEIGRGCLAERAMSLLPSKVTVREIRFWINERQPPAGRSGQRRKARSQAGKPPAGRRQPSIVTTHPTMPAEQVAGLLRSRWSQEANFKWMRQEYGLDTLAEHATEEVAGGTRVVNPGSREIGKGLKRLKARSGRLRRRQAQPGRKSTPKARAERQRVKAEIQAVEKDIAGLERARSSTPSHVLAGELPEELRLRALPGARRGLLDGLRMIACRAETAMASVLAPHLGKPAEVRALARALLQSDASLRPDPAAGTLTVQLLHTACRAHDEAVAPLIEQLNRTKTIYPGTSQRLVYEILPGPAPESPSGPSKN